MANCSCLPDSEKVPRTWSHWEYKSWANWDELVSYAKQKSRKFSLTSVSYPNQFLQTLSPCLLGWWILMGYEYLSADPPAGWRPSGVWLKLRQPSKLKETRVEKQVFQFLFWWLSQRDIFFFFFLFPKATFKCYPVMLSGVIARTLTQRESIVYCMENHLYINWDAVFIFSAG